MKNNAIYSIFLLLLIGAGVLFAGCTTSTVTNPGIAGKYVDEDNYKYFIEINSDGTFYYKNSASGGYNGKWEMKANALRLHTETLGLTIELEKQGNSIYKYTERGSVDKRYVKEG